MSKKILVTGAAGFVGFHLTEKLLERGDFVVGIDNINDYYDPRLKYSRLEHSGIVAERVAWQKEVKSEKFMNYKFIRMNLEDSQELELLCQKEKFDVIIHLAAQAGVRYSLENPKAYIQSNVVGFLNILEVARRNLVGHLVYASSSSVYGLNDAMPFRVTDNVNHPVSLYAATKKSNELMAHSYSHLYNIPTSGLRFFTVYGPWGRPDMAYYLFADAIRENRPINVFNHGKMKRDFTYIDDVVHGIINVADKPAEADSAWMREKPDASSSSAPYKIYNIGNNQPVELMEFINVIGEEMGKKPIMNMLEMQPGDVLATWADVNELMTKFNYKPDTSIQTGIKRFVQWYRQYHNL